MYENAVTDRTLFIPNVVMLPWRFLKFICRRLPKIYQPIKHIFSFINLSGWAVNFNDNLSLKIHIRYKVFSFQILFNFSKTETTTLRVTTIDLSSFSYQQMYLKNILTISIQFDLFAAINTLPSNIATSTHWQERICTIVFSLCKQQTKDDNLLGLFLFSKHFLLIFRWTLRY